MTSIGRNIGVTGGSFLARVRNRELQQRLLRTVSSYKLPFDRHNMTCNVNLPYLLRSVGLDLPDLVEAIKILINNSAHKDIIIDAIEISDSAAKISIQKGKDSSIAGTQACLVVPRTVLSRDPALLQPQPRFSPQNIDASLKYVEPSGVYVVVDRALETITPREELILRKRLGLNNEGKEYTLADVGKEFEVTREAIRRVELKALRKLRHPRQFRLLNGLQQAYSRILARWFKLKFVVPIKELEEELIKQGHLDEAESGGLLKFMRLCHLLRGDPLAIDIFPRAALIDVIDDVMGKEVAICRDVDAYSTIISYWAEKGRPLMDIEEYRMLLREEKDIFISVPDLRRILYASNKIRIEDDILASNRGQRALCHIRKLLEEKGPVHYSEIVKEVVAQTGLRPGSAWNILTESGEFVLIGEGTYDLADNHLGFKDVPYPAGIRRRSAVYAAIYSILKNYGFGHFITAKELHSEMQRKGYRWGRAAIDIVLSHKNYKAYFLTSKVGNERIIGLRRLKI